MEKINWDMSHEEAERLNQLSMAFRR